MKTLNDLYEEIVASEELKAKFVEAAKQPDTLVAFAKANGVETTAEEIAAFIKEQNEKTGELTDDELDAVAGGSGCFSGLPIPITSMTIVGCVIDVIATAIDGEFGKDGSVCG